MHATNHSTSNGLSEVERLTNRSALLTLLACCCFLAAAMAIPLTVQKTGALAARAASATPIPVGIGLAAGARATGVRLQAARERERIAQAASRPAAGGPGEA